ncbi:amidotransferase [Klebsiella michiganensis]|nr:amidotransferase [Klebsiella michiganensis]
MQIHFIVHEVFEAPGAYLHWAQARGYGISWSRVYAGDRLPENANAFDMLVVLGGPQSPRTTLSECPWFDSHAEQRFDCAGHCRRTDRGRDMPGLAAYR